jgi:catecholate siderophore receptor
VSNQALGTNGTGAQVQGDRSALTPRHSASLWTTWRLHPLWRIGAGLNYRGEQNPEGARHITAPAFTTVDAMAEVTVSDATLLKLNITNLTDKLYADSLYRGFYMPGAPRRIELSLKTLF